MIGATDEKTSKEGGRGVPSTRKDAKKNAVHNSNRGQERRRLLIAEALNDLLHERSLDGITVVDLCKEAGISRSTFYSYFEDIYEVGEWVWERRNREIFEGLGERYGYRECFARLYTHLRDDSGRTGRVLPERNFGRDPQLVTYAAANSFKLLKERIEGSRGRALTPDEYEQLDYVSRANETVTLKWFEDGMVVEPRRMARYVAEMAPKFVTDAVGA